jgi:hypothetical protein
MNRETAAVLCRERASEADGLLRKTLGSQTVLCGYPLPASRRWLGGDELEAQVSSADSLCVAEDLPVLCGHLAASGLALDLLAEAGWKLPERLLALILGEASRGRRVVTNFPLSGASVPADVDAPETDFLVSGFLPGPDRAGIMVSAAGMTRRLQGR